MPAAIGGKACHNVANPRLRAPEECLVGFEVDAWLPVAPPSLQLPVRPAVQGACQRWPASPVVLKHEGLPGSEVSRESSRLHGAALCEASPGHPY